MKKKLPKEPDPIDAEKCFRLRKASKMGLSLEAEQIEFLDKMYKKYPEWYSSLDERVFNETVPFGSNVTWANLHKRARN